MTDAEWVLLLSRGQFALTMGMHITLAALTLGLAPFLVWFEARWLWGGRDAARQALHFWIKIFALTVAIGAVSGVIMEFQFGTNWAPFSKKAGGFIGPLLFFEVLVAFFMESALTGVMLFGMGKIRPRVHFVVTCLVAFGALISAFWILAANSWMQTPVNYLRNGSGAFMPADWLAFISAPSFPLRFGHMVLASYIAVAVMIAGIAAWRLLHRPDESAARCMLVCAMWFAAVALPIQFILGDQHGENTLRYQPVKLAAMEAAWHPPSPEEGEPLRIFAVPDQRAQLNHFELAIPDIGSLYLRHNLTGHIKSLSEFPAAELPPVLPVFFAFRIMVGLGLLMFITQIAAVVQHFRGRLFTCRPLLWTMAILTPAGFIALLAGWVVTEVGRQPWLVQGLVSTAEGVSALPLGWLVISCCSVAAVYAAVFSYGMRHFLRYVAAPLPGGEVVSTKISTVTGGRSSWKD